MKKTNGKMLPGSLIKLLFMTVFLFCASFINAQNKVTGTIVDTNGEPVIGASVIIRGTAKGTVTDLNGYFILQNVPSNSVFVISYVGMKTQYVHVNGRKEINVKMEENSRVLDELVVVGYGVQKKSDVTGALVRVGEKELNERPVNNPLEALQGKAAGVDITSSERPGTIGDIRIRGNRSLKASNSPLYVVDGVPLSSGGIEALNPRDIESVDILKDASSTAIYGSRGANGVVLITTKRGKAGKLQLSYSGTVTMEHLVDKSPAMNANDYITWRRWAYYNADPEKYTLGNQPTYEQDQSYFSGDTYALANVNKGWNEDHSAWDGAKVTDTDWTDFVTKTGITQEHTLSASGGTDKVQSFVSFGYLNNEGTQKGQDYERYNLSVASDIQAKAWMKMGGSVNASYSKQNYGFSRTGQSSSSGPKDIYSAAKAILRYTVPYDDNGNIITMPGGSTTNTYTVIDEWKKSTDNRETFRVLGSMYAQVDLGKIWKPLEGLMFKTQFGPDLRYFRKGIFLDSSSATRLGSTNYARRSDERNFSWTWDNMILYNRKFGEHAIGVTLLQSASKLNKESSNMNEQNIYMSSFKWNNMGAIDVTNSDNKVGIGTGLTESQLASYMVRVNYSFKDRYLLTVSGRYDGSSVLADGNKWDFFPSAAVGWRMEQEGFMKNIKWIDQLKLRFGVGTTGNSAVDPYGTLGVISSYYMPFSTGNTRILVTNEPYYTKGSNKMPNKNLSWEKTTQYNLGLDFSFFHGRIGGTIDLYHSTTSDIIMDMTVPSLTGYPSILANVGKTGNSGLDVTFNLVPVKIDDFEWDMNLNTAYQKDKIKELANGKEDDVSNAWFIGKSINVFYGYKTDGLWKKSDADEMEKFNAKGASFEEGNVKPVDQNGDYIINADDRVVLGNKDPRWTLGWNNTFTYKGLELAIELYGRFYYMISTGGEGQLGMFQQRKINYWTPDNPNAKWQKPIYNQSGGDPYSGLLGFMNASFIKVRNISLGYNFSRKLCNKLGINNLKVYIQGKNLGNLYSSVDFMDLDMGTTYYNRGVTFGLQVNF